MSVGEGIEVEPANWRFRGDVGGPFDAQASGAVPLHHEQHELLQGISDYFVKDDSFSTKGDVDLLRRAAFVDSTSMAKYICFEGFLAIE